MTQNNQAHAVFMSYNAIGQEGQYTNGTFEENGRLVTILQHPRGQRWAGTVENLPPIEDVKLLGGLDDREIDQMGRQVEAQRRATVATLERELAGVPDTFDFLVVYVGASGSQGAVELASRYQRSKVRFVLCDCDFEAKLADIARAFGVRHPADWNIPVLPCECGGHRTMDRLVRDFIATGRVGPPA